MSHAPHLRPFRSSTDDGGIRCHVIEYRKAGMIGYMRVQ